MRANRRDFLKSSLTASTLVSMGAATVPGFVGRSARAAAESGKGNDRVLVVVQLLGGNDGLNTVVPHGIDGYPRARRRARRDEIDQIARLDRGTDDPLLGFLRRSTLAAYDSSKKLEQLVKPPGEATKYPNFGLARRLELIAQIIKAGFGTRIYYTSLDGFDTHANH